MSTYGALNGRFLANVQMAAVTALPNALIVAAEHYTTLNVSKKFLVALLVSLLYIGNE